MVTNDKMKSVKKTNRRDENKLFGRVLFVDFISSTVFFVILSFVKRLL